MLQNVADAEALLQSLGAPKRLIRHHRLVCEAAVDILGIINDLNLKVDENLVLLGAAVHDAGKIQCIEEISGPGHNHEEIGQKMLLEAGVQVSVARCCISHARYGEDGITLEELLVALSDKLWKGKRVASLELLIIDRIAEMLGQQRWDIFTHLDNCFEKIASYGDERLSRSFA